MDDFLTFVETAVKHYALNVVLPDLGTPDKARLERAMKGHVLAKHELVGTYAKR